MTTEDILNNYFDYAQFIDEKKMYDCTKDVIPRIIPDSLTREEIAQVFFIQGVHWAIHNLRYDEKTIYKTDNENV